MLHLRLMKLMTGFPSFQAEDIGANFSINSVSVIEEWTTFRGNPLCGWKEFGGTGHIGTINRDNADEEGALHRELTLTENVGCNPILVETDEAPMVGYANF